ncbi:PDR/VanB family oxidoreductase [Ramlibacter sp. AN1133]|uniref:PDR/VanB family oxidoreductase n=1 Tax=Ramlibacter sp. AN1133 TaxID=3133429 RepID=UPI0030C46A30
MTLLTAKVLDRWEEAPDIASLRLVRADGGTLPPFSPGAHIDVYLPGGHVRQYSLCNGPNEKGDYRIAVLRAPGSRGGSIAVHEQLHVGDIVTIGTPRNTFPLQHEQRSVLLAGGIGITPLLSMAKHLCELDCDFSLHYCARSPARTAFREELAASRFAHRVHYHFDDGPPEQKFSVEAAIGAPTPGVGIFVCGPSGFIEHVRRGAERGGFAPDQVHAEYFGAEPQGAYGDRPFIIQIASTGQQIVVGAERTAVQALAAAGIEIMTSCEQGFCGTCVTRVLAGECDHRDICLSAEEKERNAAFTPCCSRASTPLLVLDL